MNGRQEGFTLTEVLVSVVLLSILLTTLAGLTFVTAQQAVLTSDATTRQAESLELVNRLAALPFDSLSGAAGCDTAGTVNNQYSRCVTVTGTSRSVTVQIVTTPLQRVAPASTVELVRSAPSRSNPLCTSC